MTDNFYSEPKVGGASAPSGASDDGIIYIGESDLSLEYIQGEIERLREIPWSDGSGDPRLRAIEAEITESLRLAEGLWNDQVHPPRQFAANDRWKAATARVADAQLSLERAQAHADANHGLVRKTQSILKAVGRAALAGSASPYPGVSVRGGLSALEAECAAARADLVAVDVELAALRQARETHWEERARTAVLIDKRDQLRLVVEREDAEKCRLWRVNLAHLEAVVADRAYLIERLIDLIVEISVERGDQAIGFRDEDAPWRTFARSLRQWADLLVAAPLERAAIKRRIRAQLRTACSTREGRTMIEREHVRIERAFAGVEIMREARQMTAILRRFAEATDSGAPGFQPPDVSWKSLDTHTRGLVARFSGQSTDRQIEIEGDFERSALAGEWDQPSLDRFRDQRLKLEGEFEGCRKS